jgi:L-arabinose isomerase
MGWSINGYAVGDLASRVSQVTDAEVNRLVKKYEQLYKMDKALMADGERRGDLKNAARIELGMKGFLQDGGFKGFTTCFEDLTGLAQLPGLAVQRLMADGYGFGAEGDWKTAALVRAMKVMGEGLEGGSSFMEDYTYDLDPAGAKVLGAHMLEVCASLSAGQASLEIHPLFVGGKDDPARLVFNAAAGPAVNATLVDMGNRFRMIVNEVDVVKPKAALPKLPVARAVWKPRPSLEVSAAAWILAGGAHHFGFSQAITAEHLEDYTEMAGVEFVLIDGKTDIRQLKNELRWNELYYGLAKGF